MKASDVQAFAARGASVVQGLHAGLVKIGGTEYAAAVGVVPLELVVDEGGELMVQIRKSVLATCPAARTKVEAQGRKWRVVSGYGHPLAPVWTLRMEADQ
jgi:hypothetical protein